MESPAESAEIDPRSGNSNAGTKEDGVCGFNG
jgi:hypothetical protein